MSYCQLAKEMKNEYGFIVWALCDGKPMAVEPRTRCVYEYFQYAELMTYNKAVWHLERLRDDGCYDVYLGFVDEEVNLKLFDL